MDKNVLNSTKSTIEVAIRITLLSLLVIWCLVILYPFIIPVVWGVVIAVSLSPVYLMMVSLLKGKKKMAAVILTVSLLLLILLPSISIIDSVSSSISKLATGLQDGSLSIPAPQENIKTWPIVGENIYSYWNEASLNIEETLVKYKDQVGAFAKWLLSGVTSLLSSILLLALSIIIGSVLLATRGTSDFTVKFFEKVVGKEKGREFAEMSEKTIMNVTKGILGVSFVQGLALGIIFYFAGVPYPGLLGLLCMVLAIIQVGPSPVSLSVIAYLFYTQGTAMASLWSFLIVIAMLSDNVLKPMVLGKGAQVPMLIIFLGSIGGFITGGFLGLFSGAIVLSLGYKLFQAWIESVD